MIITEVEVDNMMKVAEVVEIEDTGAEVGIEEETAAVEEEGVVAEETEEDSEEEATLLLMQAET